MAAFVCVDNVLNVIEKCIGNELHIVSSENRLNLHKILTQSLLASVIIEKICKHLCTEKTRMFE